MSEEYIKEIPQWEEQYLSLNKNLTPRQKEILNGDDLKSNEGMIFGEMYSDWKKIKGWE